MDRRVESFRKPIITWEVATEVIDGPQSRVIPQAHHRLSAARGVLAMVLGGVS